MIFQSSSEFRFTLSIVLLLLLHLLFPSRKEEMREFVIYQLNLSHDPLLDFCFTTKSFSSPPSFFLFLFCVGRGSITQLLLSSSPLFSWEMDAESSPLLLCATLRIYEVDGWMDEVW